LAALGDVDVLNGHLLLAAASVPLQCLDLRRRTRDHKFLK
jgi:hypothetical protein